MNWRLFVSAIAITLLARSAFASPQTSTNADATFTSNTELVTVPVHVADHYGQPLHGLKKEDFALQSDGKPERIGLFEEMRTETPAAPTVVRSATAGPAAAPGATPLKFSNLETGIIPQQMYILAVDTVNTPALLQGWARDHLIQYLKANPFRQPVELVAITSGGLRQLHGFSTDNESLIESLKKMNTSLSRRDSQQVYVSHMDPSGRIDSYKSVVNSLQEIQASESALGADAGSVTLRCFEELAWAYAGIPGRKTVLWFTSGFPIFQEVFDGPAMIGHGPGMAGRAAAMKHNELLPDFQRAFTAMNKANVVVYPIDVNGLPVEEMWDPSQPASLYIHPELSHFGPAQLVDVAGADRDGMKELAHRTGGKTCTAGNNLNFCLERAVTESSDYYLLGFYVPQQQRKVGWHKLKVSVAVDHGEVRTRTSYYLRPLGVAVQQEQEEDLRSAIHAPVNYTGVLFSVEPGAPADTPKSPMTFKISVPASSILLMAGQEKLSFDVITVPLSDKGVPLPKEFRLVKLDLPETLVQKALAKGWNLIDSVPGDKSIAAVRVVIRDNYTGRIGSVLCPLLAQSGGKS